MIASASWVGASGNTYELYKTNMSWAAASAYATSIGGYLVKVETSAENTELFNKLRTYISTSELNNTRAPDGGNAAYVWLGANDATTEGVWRWAKDSSVINASRTEWGRGNLGREPDNYGNQDYLAMGLQNWPSGYSNGAGYGNAGQWNDISVNNSLYFVVEKASALDTTPPILTSSAPSDSGTGVGVGDNIVLNFNEAVKAGTGNFIISIGSTIITTISVTDTSQVGFNGSTLWINPKNNLSHGTTYSLTATASAVKDIAGNGWAGLVSNPIDFTTASQSFTDVTKPVVQSFTPSDGLTGVALDSDIVVIFNESIKPSTGTIFLRKGSLTGPIVNTTWSWSNNTDTIITIDPAENLDPNTRYFLVMAAACVKDTAGNNFAGSNIYDFTTGSVPPTSGADRLDGTSAADTINALAGNDTITGGGGIDRMDGGDGGDIFIIAAPSEHTAAEINDSGSSGTDELRFAATATGTLTLFAGDVGLETVVIGTGTAASAVATGTVALNVNASAVLNALSISGNAGANTLTGTGFSDLIRGNAGNDSLIGNGGNDTLYGGAGSDRLSGGLSNDTFVFDSTPKASTNMDTITDFVSGQDVISLSKSVFTAFSALSAGSTITSAQFLSGAGVVKGSDADDRIVYNTSTGALYYDADGSGSSAAVQIAILSTRPSVSYTDFVIF